MDRTTVREARDAYLAENGFTLAEYDAPYTKASAFGVDFEVPNTPRHSAAIKLHDLHHVATAYGTDMIGEGEISLWELRGGLRGLDLYVSAIIAVGALGGAVLAPRRAWRAWRSARTARPLWTLDVPYEKLLAMTVDELRALVGAPARDVASTPRKLHKNAPRVAAAIA